MEQTSFSSIDVILNNQQMLSSSIDMLSTNQQMLLSNQEMYISFSIAIAGVLVALLLVLILAVVWSGNH